MSTISPVTGIEFPRDSTNTVATSAGGVAGTIFERDGRIWSRDERGILVSDTTGGLDRQLDADSYRRFIRILITYIEGKRHATRRSTVSRVLPPIVKALEATGSNQSPRSVTDWQALVREIYKAVLTNQRARIETRVFSYNRVLRPFLQYCIREQFIPFDVVVPKMKRVGELVRGGGPKNDFVPVATSTSPKCPDAYLVSIDLARTDIEYLDALQFETEARLATIENAATAHFELVASHWKVGTEILRTTDIDNLVEVHKPKGTLTPERFAEEIALSKITNGGVYCRRHKHELVVLRDRGRAREAAVLDKLTGLVANHIPTADRINWMLGNLTIVDIAIAALLLLIKNPKWRVESLLYSDLVSREGATYLRVNDNGAEFSIFKERAKHKKTSTLDDSSRFVLETVVGMTAEARVRLNSSKLFIGTAKHRQPKTPHKGMLIRAMYCRGCPKTSVLAFLRLGDRFGPGDLSYTKIKNSTGLLEFLRTGSIRAVARILGNKESTALRHYVPPSIIGIWNTRQVRRMQNLVLAAATADRSYLAKATDFRNPEDLARFVRDIIQCAGYTSNPLVKRLRAISADGAFEAVSGTLLVSISAQSLTAVYAAHRCVALSGASFSDLSDSAHTLKELVVLSQFLQAHLVEHKNSRFRLAHSVALQKSEGIAKQLRFEDLTTMWDRRLR